MCAFFSDPYHPHSYTPGVDCHPKPRCRCEKIFFSFFALFHLSSRCSKSSPTLNCLIEFRCLYFMCCAVRAHYTHMQTPSTTQHNNVAVISIVFFPSFPLSFTSFHIIIIHSYIDRYIFITI